jgi:signal transduction histidine kinase
MHEHPETTSPTAALARVEDCFSGGGEMGARMRAFDWASTPLGPVARWPQSLRTAVSICLQSRFPIVIFWGPELLLLYNDAYITILGRNKHPRALGQPGLVCWAEIAHIIGPMLRGVLSHGEATWSEDQMLPVARNGVAEEGYFTFSYSPIRDAPGSIGGVFCAVTETTAQVLEARRRAELDRAKTEFFSNVSHELRTPLTLILGPVEDAIRSGRALSGEPLDALHRNARRLLRMVNALLDFSRVEAGRAEAQREPVDLAAFTADLASVFRAAIEDAGLSLVVDCPKLAAPVWVDRQHWEKIVLNLVSNAFKFTFEGVIRVALGATGDRVVLRVEDTGTGIPAAELPRLFDRFHRVQGARSRTHEGTGIGLALVRELVRLHGGTVDVDSEVGRGSTFTVTIPRDDAAHALRDRARREETASLPDASFFGDEARRWLPTPPAGQPPTPATPSAAAQAAGPRARVLVADDNTDMRTYLCRILAEHGFDVDAAPDGATALEAARAAPPDLVLTDVMMPGLDGFGLLQALRADERTRGVPVVMVSARAGEEARASGLAQGADDYLVKPFSARELCVRAASLVEVSRLRREAEREREALRRSEAALLEASRRKDEFLAVLGHELRNPLAPMRFALQILDGRVPADDRSRRYIEILSRQTATLTRLVEDLLDVSRITRGAVELRRERVDLEQIARFAFEAVRPLLEARRHAVAVSVPAEPIFVLGDPVRLEQVVVNLLTNAARYTDPGGCITLAVERDGDHARIRVKDTGIGIAREKLDRIFELFAQAVPDLSRAQGGLGIGLTVVKGLVEQHGGTVTAASAGPGKGTEIVVLLPRAPAPAATEVPPSSPAPPPAAPPRRVLVVDDNQHAAEMLSALLADAGHTVSIANDGPTALRLAEERAHDVVLLDLGLPGMDGFEVARRLRRSGGAARAALVAVTGYGGGEYRARAREAGFDLHVVKPISPEALAAILARGAEAAPPGAS